MVQLAKATRSGSWLGVLGQAAGWRCWARQLDGDACPSSWLGILGQAAGWSLTKVLAHILGALFLIGILGMY